ncbi:MAG: hypothetical protein KDB03_28110 [Planctomycetales bacterium]|nr:hypothetical protein [Planctomycetales bacterium]
MERIQRVVWCIVVVLMGCPATPRPVTDQPGVGNASNLSESAVDEPSNRLTTDDRKSEYVERGGPGQFRMSRENRVRGEDEMEKIEKEERPPLVEGAKGPLPPGGNTRVLPAVGFVKLCLDEMRYAEKISYHLFDLQGAVRRVAPNRFINMQYAPDEFHIVDLWHDVVTYDDAGHEYAYKPLYALFRYRDQIDKLAPNQMLTIRCEAPDWNRQHFQFLVGYSEILSFGPKPDNAPTAIQPLLVEQIEKQRTAFNEAAKRLVNAGYAGFGLGGYFLTLRKGALTEDGGLKPDVVEELPNLSGLYQVQIPKEISAAGLKQLAEVPGVREVFLNLPFERLMPEDLKLLSSWPVEHLSFNPPRMVNDEMLASAGKLTTLCRLFADGDSSISDSGVQSLSGLSHLQELYVRGKSITDAGFAHLASLKNLRMLSIGGPSVDGSGLAHLNQLETLFRLSLWAPQGTPASLDAIGQLSQLTWLQVHSFSTLRDDPGTPDIGDAGFLASLKKLRVLQLNRVSGINSGFSKSLDASRELFGIDITDSQIPDGSFGALQLPRLQVINLSRSQISDDEAVKLISSSSNVEYLKLHGTPITDLTVMRLPRIEPNLQAIGLRDTKITKKSRTAILQLRQLKNLTVSDVFSDEEQQQLQDEHPANPRMNFE